MRRKQTNNDIDHIECSWKCWFKFWNARCSSEKRNMCLSIHIPIQNRVVEYANNTACSQFIQNISFEQASKEAVVIWILPVL